MKAEFGVLFLICSLASMFAAPINETFHREEPFPTSTDSSQVVIISENVTATVTQTTNEVILDSGKASLNATQQPSSRAGTDKMEDYEASFDGPVVSEAMKSIGMNSTVPDSNKESSTMNVLNEGVSTLEQEREPPAGNLTTDKPIVIVNSNAESEATLNTPATDALGLPAETRDSSGEPPLQATISTLDSPDESLGIQDATVEPTSNVTGTEAADKTSGSAGLFVSFLCIVMLLVL